MMKKTMFSRLWKQGVSLAASCAIAVAALPAFSVSASETEGELTKAGSLRATAETMTADQPFPAGTGGSYSFRIPDLISLDHGEHKGNLVAAADARYATPGDGGGLDTIASVSTDMGKTWSYSFPIWFPDSKGYAGKNATTVIDPVLVEGADGTIFCMADVNPTGITTHYGAIPTGNGYIEVGGKKRLALTDRYEHAGKNPNADTTSYPYYVGDFTDGYAPVLKRADSSATNWRVDEWYNIEEKDGNTYVPLAQEQVNTDEQIQQNVFYRDSKLHVYNIGYIWVVESRDGGYSWENPRIINDQVKPETGEQAILVSPGKGLTTSKGVITVPFYGQQGGEKASFIYSKDHGKTWKRTNNVSHLPGAGKSSESEMVELSDGTLRMFSRTQKNANHICYTDAVEDENGDFTLGTMVDTGVSCWSDCNVTAICYSKKSNGKDLVLVACPGGSSKRTDGKIYSFEVNADRSMSLLGTFDLREEDENYDGSFAYSCMDELEDGTIGILWEPTISGYIGNAPYRLVYDNFAILEAAPNASLSDTSVEVKLHERTGSYTRTYTGAGTVTQEPQEEIAALSVRKEAGDAVTLTLTKGSAQGTTTAVVDGVTYQISVTDGARNVALEQGAAYHVLGTNAEILSGASVKIQAAQKYFLYNHLTNGNGFEAAADVTADLDHSLLTFTTGKTEDTWRIKSTFIDHYLTNSNVQESYYFNPIPADMTVEAVSMGSDTVFRIKNSDDSYICYKDAAKVFSRDSYQESYTGGTFDLTLFKRKEDVSGTDMIPGFERVSEIVSGEEYLVTCIRNGEVMVLYPYTEDVASWTSDGTVGNNSRKARTKLFKNTPVTQWTVTGVFAGETSVVDVDGKRYAFDVQEPVSKSAVSGSFPEVRKEAEEILAAGQGQYTSATWAALREVCESILGAEEDLSVSGMKGFMDSLAAAKKNLSTEDPKLAAAKKHADQALEEAKAVYSGGKKNYTDQSWAVFQSAYLMLKNMSHTTNADALIKYTMALLNAQKGLKEKQDDSGQILLGKVYVNGNYYYKVTDLSKCTVEVTGMKEKMAKKIAVPNQVTLGAKTYQVTSIAASAFKNSKKAASAVIGKSVATIGNHAFAGCAKLKKVSVNSVALKTIGSKVFYNCKNMKNLTLKTKKLTKVGKNTFKGIHKKAVIKVPSAKYKAYTKLLAKKGQSKTVKVKKG